MKYGFSIPPVQHPQATARSLESLGYDFVATGEHVLFHSPCTNAFVTLAACAGSTESIGLLAAATLLPVYPAALAGKMAMELDRLSSGRFIMGVGVGGEYPVEFEACGVDVSTRGSRFDESLGLMQAMFEGRTEGYSGRFGSLPPGVVASPAPHSRCGPSIWIAGRGPKAQLRVATNDAGWLPYMFSPERLAASVETIRELAQNKFEREWRGPVACVLPLSLHVDPARARENAARRLSETYGRDMTTAVSRYTLAGTPEQVHHRLAEYGKAGLETAILLPLCAEEDLERVADQFLTHRTETLT